MNQSVPRRSLYTHSTHKSPSSTILFYFFRFFYFFFFFHHLTHTQPLFVSAEQNRNATRYSFVSYPPLQESIAYKYIQRYSNVYIVAGAGAVSGNVFSTTAAGCFGPNNWLINGIYLNEEEEAQAEADGEKNPMMKNEIISIER